MTGNLPPRPPCKHIQGDHCTKIGGKCVEYRWFSHAYLMKKTKPLPRPKAPPGPE